LTRLFISHSHKDNVIAVAFKQWLGTNGWADEDVFVDLDDIGAGERWKEALHKANARCEAVILLASPESLASPECLAEVRKAEDFGKEIIVVLLADVRFDDRRLDSVKDRQIVELVAEPQSHSETVNYHGETHEAHFNADALAAVRSYLVKRGIAPEHFSWPPKERPNAEPFPGLAAYKEDDAGIFFGRDADILRGLDRLRLLRRNRQPRLLVIQAASGAGKSSYLRAGLWPRLKRDSDFAPLAILRPAQGILTGPDGLGRQLARELTRPSAPLSRGDISSRLTEPDVQKAAAAFIELMSLAATQAREMRLAGDQKGRAPALVLAIDQAEELFAVEDASESLRFLDLLANFLQNAPETIETFVLLTIRVESADQLLRALASHSLEPPDAITLLPLAPSSYRDVILRPIDVAARRGQRITVEPALAERLTNDAVGADALPLLAFTLLRLYHDYGETGKLTLTQYETMGGVGGSIQKALQGAIAKSGAAGAGENLRRLIIPYLATWDSDTDTAKRIVARTTVVIGGRRSLLKPLAERLVESRLLLSSAIGNETTLEVAHEALLRVAPVADWLKDDREFLIFKEDIGRAERRWREEMKRADQALLTGFDLARGEEWLPKRAEDLSTDLQTFIQASLRRDRTEKQKRLRFQRRVSVGATLAALVMTGVGAFAVHQRQRADTELQNAYISQSRFLADVSRQAAGRSDGTTGALIALEALPEPTASKRPYVEAAERALYNALLRN
jgi:conflict system STAND superfamily ATPase/TIR domain-containing protein